MGNWIVNLGMMMMLLGIAVTFGIFNRIGPVETPKGMKRLGWGLVAAGFLVALSQSERTPAPPQAQASAPENP